MLLINLVCCLQHDAVLECAVLGLPDEAYGEVICAIIVPKEDAKKKAGQDSKPALTLEALTSWSKDKLAPYKVCYLHYFPFFPSCLLPMFLLSNLVTESVTRNIILTTMFINHLWHL
jgi:acyl-CoA synthetase (AMP-forming)/AMP-acid ligase II